MCMLQIFFFVTLMVKTNSKCGEMLHLQSIVRQTMVIIHWFVYSVIQTDRWPSVVARRHSNGHRLGYLFSKTVQELQSCKQNGARLASKGTFLKKVGKKNTQYCLLIGDWCRNLLICIIYLYIHTFTYIQLFFLLNCTNLTQRQALKVGCENIWNLPRHLSTYSKSKYMFYRKVHTYIIYIYIYRYTYTHWLHICIYSGIFQLHMLGQGSQLTAGAPKWKFRKKWCSLSKAGLSIFAASMCVFKFFWGEGGVGDKCKPSYSHVLGPFFWKSTMVVKAFGCETCMTLRRNYCRFYWKRYQIEGCQYVYRSSSWKFYVDKPMFRPFRWCGLFPGVFFLPVVIFLDSSMYFPISRL